MESAALKLLHVGLTVIRFVMGGVGLQLEKEIFVEAVVFRDADVVSGEGTDRCLGFPERDHQKMCGLTLDTT